MSHQHSPTHTADLGFSLLPFGSFGDLSRVMVGEICRGPKPEDSSAEHIQPKGWRTVNFPWFSILEGPSIPVSSVLFSDVHVNEVHVFPPSVRQVAPLLLSRFLPFEISTVHILNKLLVLAPRENVVMPS